MKKKINKPMRAAGALLVATMLTTCMTAGTFAKYVTSDSATDSARVAKFGVTVAINGSLFGEEYEGNPSSGTGSANSPIAHTGIFNDVGTGTVQAYTNSGKTSIDGVSNVVAPGTENGTGMGFSVKGKPEVDCYVDINIEAKNIYLKKDDYAVMQTVFFANSDEYEKAVKTGTIYKYSTTWTLEPTTNTKTNYDSNATYCRIKEIVTKNDFNDMEYYYPVQYTLTDSRTSVTSPSAAHHDPLTKGVSEDSIKFILQQMYNLADPTATSYNTKEDTTTGYTNVKFRTYVQEANREFDKDFPQEVLTWKWDFDNNGAGTYDKLDTVLGNLVAQEGLAEATDILYTKTPSKPTSISDIKCTVVVKDGTSYKVPKNDSTATTTSDSDHILKITNNDGNYNLKTAVYFSATVTQKD